MKSFQCSMKYLLIYIFLFYPGCSGNSEISDYGYKQSFTNPNYTEPVLNPKKREDSRDYNPVPDIINEWMQRGESNRVEEEIFSPTPPNFDLSFLRPAGPQDKREMIRIWKLVDEMLWDDPKKFIRDHLGLDITHLAHGYGNITFAGISPKNVAKLFEEMFFTMNNPLQDMIDSGMVRSSAISEKKLQNLPVEVLRNLSVSDFLGLLQGVDIGPRTLRHLIFNLQVDVFNGVLNLTNYIVKREMHDMHEHRGMVFPPVSVTSVIVEAGKHHWGHPRSWDADQVHQIGLHISGMNMETIKELSLPAFEAAVYEFALLDQYGLLDPVIAVVLVDQAKHLWGPLPAWDPPRFKIMDNLMIHLSAHDVHDINPDILLLLLPDIKHWEFSKPQGRALVDTLTQSKNWTWSEDQLLSLGDLTKYLSARTIHKLPPSAFSNPDLSVGLSTAIPGRGRNKKEIARQVTANMAPPSNWTRDDVETAKGILDTLQVKDLEMIPDDVIRDAATSLVNSTFTPKQKNLLARKFIKAGNGSGRPKASDIQQMGPLCTGLRQEDFAQMTADDIKESVEVLAENAKEMDVTKRKEIVKQLRRASGGLGESLTQMGDMVQEIPLRDLDSIGMDDIGFQAESANGSEEVTQLPVATLNWNTEQSMKIFRRFKNEFLGGEQNLNSMTADTIRTLGNVAKGMSCDDISRMETNDVFTVIAAMMESKGWSMRQTRCMANKVRSTSNRDDFAANFTDVEILSLTGEVLKEFSFEELSHLPDNECDMTMATIGGTESVFHLRKMKRKELLDYVLKCLGNEDHGNIITGSDFRIMGYLACDLTVEALQTIHHTNLVDNLDMAKECCFSQQQMAVLHDALVEELGSPDTWDSNNLFLIGPLLMVLTPTEISFVNETEFTLVAEDVMFQFTEFKAKRDEYCKRDLKESDLQAREDGFVQVAIKAKESFVASANLDGSRRKRAIYSPTCDEIESLGGGNVVWTEEELAAMSTETFDNCGNVLGEVANLSSSQIDTLLTKAKETWGSAGDMTPDEISQLGRIASAFSVEEISQLNLTNLEAVFSIGKYNMWSFEQLVAGASRYLSLNHDSDVTSLNSVHLSGLGNFFCGLTTTQMALINSSSFIEAASVLGNLQSCDSTQWAVVKEFVIEEYGNISSWQPEVFAEVKSLIAGFTVEELSSLNISAISGITPQAISLIPPLTFASGFGVTQLENFDTDQVQAVTSEQTNVLAYEQKMALAVAEYGEGSIPDDVLQQIISTTWTKMTPDVTTDVTREDRKFTAATGGHTHRETQRSIAGKTTQPIFQKIVTDEGDTSAGHHEYGMSLLVIISACLLCMSFIADYS